MIKYVFYIINRQTCFFYVHIGLCNDLGQLIRILAYRSALHYIDKDRVAFACGDKPVSFAKYGAILFARSITYGLESNISIFEYSEKL